MSNQFSGSINRRLSEKFTKDDIRDRRLFEMYRRFKALHFKRFHLRNELEAVEKYLVSLDKQIKSYEQNYKITLK